MGVRASHWRSFARRRLDAAALLMLRPQISTKPATKFMTQ
jgi:hypothetical protein